MGSGDICAGTCTTPGSTHATRSAGVEAAPLRQRLLAQLLAERRVRLAPRRRRLRLLHLDVVAAPPGVAAVFLQLVVGVLPLLLRADRLLFSLDLFALDVGGAVAPEDLLDALPSALFFFCASAFCFLYLQRGQAQ